MTLHAREAIPSVWPGGPRVLYQPNVEDGDLPHSQNRRGSIIPRSGPQWRVPHFLTRLVSDT